MMIFSSELPRGALRREPPKGLDAFANRCLGLAIRWSGLRRRLHRQTEGALKLGTPWRHESEAALSRRLLELRDDFRRGRPGPAPAALALIAEAARRALGLAAHPEQIMGALAAHAGLLAEMATGEGKTLTIGLAATLAGWRGRPVHLLTANDYLAARDAAWLEPLYARCGLRGGAVISTMDFAARRAGYACDITHTTPKEAVADFLRDRLLPGVAAGPERARIRELLGGSPNNAPAMRGLHTAIVDEADSVLINEAVTPLIISREEDNAPLREACAVAGELAASLIVGRDYALDAARSDLTVAPDALARLAAGPCALPGIWQAGHRRLELVRQALVAREFFHLGKHYIIEGGKIVIVDEFTGRLMPDRKWRQGLHQAIEAKEGLDISPPAETLARLSFQRYFRRYRRLAGLSGTAAEEAAELWQVYGLPVVRIPTHRPCIRQLLPDAIFADAASKWRAVTAAIERQHRAGRPVLIGTRTVAVSEHLASLLRGLGLPFNLLNARFHAEEARIVAEAGHAARITIATNMAGRGTDIVLGPGVAAAGGLHVVATERHEARRIDRQLFGRCARQGDPGSAQAFISLEDELFQRHTPGWLRQAAAHFLRLGVPGAHTLSGCLLSRTQSASQRLGRRQRGTLLEMDVTLEEDLAFAGDRV